MLLNICVYILECRNGQYYTGVSSNILERLDAHNSGKVAFTSTKRPLKLVHISFFEDKIKAYNFERYLKTGSGIAFRNRRLV